MIIDNGTCILVSEVYCDNLINNIKSYKLCSKLHEHYKIWPNKKTLSCQFMHTKEGHYQLYQYLKHLLLFGIIQQHLYDLLRNVLI